MFNKIKTFSKTIYSLQQLLSDLVAQAMLQNKLTAELVSLLRVKTANNQFARVYSKKGFSQSDEDGLLSEILDRLHIRDNGVFIELGVGNGLENNTLALLLAGWAGVWISGQEVIFNVKQINNFSFIKEWITKDNVSAFLAKGLSEIQESLSHVQLLSIDLDGNDYYILDELLRLDGFKPDVIICEYNAGFGPNLKWIQKYDPTHKWKSDMYFGASLASIVELCSVYGYKPICCNPRTGANVFFVKNDALTLFPEIPDNLAEIFEEGFFPPPYYKFLHRIDATVINKVFDKFN